MSSMEPLLKKIPDPPEGHYRHYTTVEDLTGMDWDAFYTSLLCVQGGARFETYVDSTTTGLRWHFWYAKKNEPGRVTCLDCLEWMHA